MRIFIITLVSTLLFSCNIDGKSFDGNFLNNSSIENKKNVKSINDFIEFIPKEVNIYSGENFKIILKEKVKGFLLENLISITDNELNPLLNPNVSNFLLEFKDDSYIISLKEAIYSGRLLKLNFRNFSTVEIKINVNIPKVEDFEFSSKKVSIKIGQNLSLNFKIKFNYSNEFIDPPIYGKYLIYKNLTPEIIRLENNNSITGLKSGLGKILITDQTGSKQKIIEILIINDYFPSLKNKIIFGTTLSNIKGVFALDPLESENIELLFPSNYNFVLPEINNDGKTILFSSRDIETEAYVKSYTIETNGRNLKRVNPSFKVDYKECRWSPDGIKIICSTEQLLNIFNKNTGDFQIISDNKYFINPKWSYDGKNIYFSEIDSFNNFKSYTFDLESKEFKEILPKNIKKYEISFLKENKKMLFLNENSLYIYNNITQENKLIKSNIKYYTLSPNEEQIAFSDDKYELFIMNSDGSNIKPLNVKVVNNFTWSKY